MTEFGDFGNIDIDKLLSGAQQQLAQVEELQRRTAELVGRAQDKDGLVTVEYTGQGLHELQLNPRAMRLASVDLAALIKTTVQEAVGDLARQTNELMEEMFGVEDNPMKLLSDPEAALAQVKQAEAAYNHTFEEVMSDLDQIRRRLQP
ncbi:YbaB/EbfC family nucleoid-associated protein [Sphaerisporangium perillae]|uniref:YbaB/EbfC family nucleoid-associated protein n=1 Tax=Sphaerisporangium perillae TaxID=2935860 RepID=UPI00200FFAF2|nr:YbaB/EbfC family nucleoid-associated protein [Sphaerisporangium perillae]